MSRRRLPERVELSIDALDDDGFGCGDVCDRPVTLKGGLLGERVIARVVGKRRGRYLAVADTVEVASPERVAPPCPNFPRCGGCAHQHWRYDAQLAFKRQRVVAQLERAGVEPDAFQPDVAVRPLRYRRRARLGVRCLERAGEVFVGFREAFGNKVVRMNECLTLEPPLDGLIGPLKTLVGSLSIAARIPQVELAKGDDAAAVVIRHLDPLSNADVDAMTTFARDHDIRVLTQSGGYETIRVLAPPDAPVTLTYRNDLEDLRLAFSPVEFIQINHAINERLVSAALRGAGVGPGDRVLDLFCGIGNFSLAAARHAAYVVGVETSAAAVERATGNAQANALSHRCRFHRADIYRDAPPVPVDDFDALLLDPPRSGTGEAIGAWIGSRMARIAYVSCNPATFADDAKRLQAMGFDLKTVGLFDMFPHTLHIETLGVFERR